MAPNTRTLTSTTDNQSKEMDLKFAEVSKQINGMESSIAQLIAAMTEMQKQQSSQTESTRGVGNDSGIVTNNSGVRNLHFTPKLEFPKFNGSDVRTWIKKCGKYFALCKIPDNQKVDIASLHMTDKAEGWVTSYLSARLSVNWEEFIVDVAGRFRDESGINVVEQFNKLQQIGDLEAYVDDFEHLRAVMLQSNHVLPEGYILDSFIGGLRPAVKPFVKAFKPASISSAIEYARLQEESLQATRNSKSSYQFQGKPMLANTKPPLLPNPPVITKFPNNNLSGQSNGKGNNKYIPADVRAEKIAKGLCYYCDQRYERGHKCKFKEPQLFTVEIPGDLTDRAEEVFMSDEEVDSQPTDVPRMNDKPVISVNALAGNQNFQTMRVRGLVNGKTIYILIDTGSTHNFLDENIAKEMGIQSETIDSQMITVADGNKMVCNKLCKQFGWEMQQVHFETEVMLIPLGSCDMVLGIQWLSTLGPVFWDFKQLRMDFVHNEKSLSLKGMPLKKVKVWEKGPSQKMLQNAAQLCFLQLIQTTPQVDQMETGVAGKGDIKSTNEGIISAELEELKSKFSQVFKEPTELPPSRGIMDHQIPLMPGSTPVNIRPYRYPLKQKDIIEQLVQEMLDRGIIQDSASPFASPVVLVGKKDGTWRLCIDYRELNKRTVKDKFPIPVIEELMDELAGSTVFSKLDLRAGYHQMRLHEDDVFKTAFKTHTGHYEFLVMPFGLTNAPASFQRWMNTVFKTLLRKHVLVFFDDILVYSKNINDHWMHLSEVFQLMSDNQLYAKGSKCFFATSKIEYLGHFISAEGLSTDPKKIQAVADWPIPQTLKQLRSFLGLSGYYRKFVRNYAVMCKPLTDLLKKGAFMWSDQAQTAFDIVKKALISVPVLALPDFSKVFTVETDASQTGIGAVLVQQGHPLAFISRALGPRWRNLSVYEKELLAIVFAVQKWEQYLMGAHFIIKTDQKSLKWLLEQKISTPFQQFWLSKLLGFDYEIQYNKGSNNAVADALSRVQGAEVLYLAISVISSDLGNHIKNSYALDPCLLESCGRLQKGELIEHLTMQDGFLRKHGKLVIGPDKGLREKILNWHHSTPDGGHSGRDITLQRVKHMFVWKGLTKDVSHWIRNCAICQQMKYDTAAYPGLLQPLPIPEEVWTDVSMDFITGLPNSQGYSVIFVVVDRLSKYAHFIPLKHPFDALQVAQAYLDNVFKLHGWPKSILSDRDSIFLSKFWQALFSLHGTVFKMSSAYHPATDGQTEVVNRCLETYLRCMCSDNEKDWIKWLALAEWWYNTHYHTEAKLSPYEIVYNQPPPLHLPYLPGESDNHEVDRSLSRREQMIYTLKFHLSQSQNRMKVQADKHRSERVFQVGDWVWLKLQPYRQITLQHRINQKISSKYCGPFQIIAKIGEVAYKLKLSAEVKIHDVVHVSQLKAFHGSPPAITTLPQWFDHVPTTMVPLAILDHRMVPHQNAPQIQYLVQWKDASVTDNTWMEAQQFAEKFPALVRKGDSIGEFLRVMQQQLAPEFRKIRTASVENLLYVKEDFIIPQQHSFYEPNVNKARGKSGSLFHFDVHEDVRTIADATIEKDEEN